MSSETEQDLVITRREAIRRVTALLGGVALVGGTNLLTACEKASVPVEGNPGKFTPEDVAYLDEIAETILPRTNTPGAKDAKTGAFMALMVSESYSPEDQRVFRDGMTKLDDATKKAHNVGFMAATPQQRLSVLTALDKEAISVMDARERAERKKKGLAPDKDAAAPTGDAYLPDQRQENAPNAADANPAPGITKSEPAHYFRMMKELALLGYFTSEPGATKALRYVESPGRFDPCIPYTKGEPALAAHA